MKNATICVGKKRTIEKRLQSDEAGKRLTNELRESIIVRGYRFAMRSMNLFVAVLVRLLTGWYLAG